MSFTTIEFKTNDGNWAKTMISNEKLDSVVQRLSKLTEVNILKN